jgi:hypothetical protein
MMLLLDCKELQITHCKQQFPVIDAATTASLCGIEQLGE